jgi:hypothetical protein
MKVNLNMKNKIQININKLSSTNWMQTLISGDYMATIITTDDPKFSKMICFEKVIDDHRRILWIHKNFAK